MASRRVRESNSPGTTSSCSVPSGLRGITRSSAPTRAQSICHGTMLAWCSISLMMMLSPAPTLAFPQLLATRLMPSVVPRTNTSSSADPALRKLAACWRTASIRAVASALRVWIPRCTAA
ncbi:Uncharacterised protein [Klebsiella pneumoniae]|nr:Uncharacterised protein [Klebsiella pneumoniae]